MTRRRRRSAAWRVGFRVLPALALMVAVAACEASSGAETPRDRTAAAAQPTATATVAAPAPSLPPAAPEPTPTATTAPSNGSDSSDDSRAGSVIGHGPTWSATTCRPYPSYFWMLWRNFLQWNPDGSEILITYGLQLYAVATDGSDTRTVARGETPQGFGSMISFDLSPDGRQLVFTGCDYPRPHFQIRAEPEDYLGYEYELARLGPKIGEPERLTSNHEFDGFPAWSPDGQRVAFLSVLLTDRLSHAGYVGARWLSVMDRGGRGLRIVVQVEAPARSRFRGLALVAPAWSPDGRHVAFAAADADGRVGIYVVPVDGAKQLRLHDLRPLVTDAVSGPAWSPDGQRLVYAKMADDLLGLYAVGADGADEAEIVTIAWLLSDRRGIPPPAEEFGLVRDVAWSPDGTRLLYSYGAATCVVSADGELLGRTPVIPFAPEFGRWDCVLTPTDESEQQWRPWITEYPPGWFDRSKEAESSAVWSPDGERVAFFRTWGNITIWDRGDATNEYPVGTTVHLYAMRPDGSELQLLASIGSTGPALPDEPFSEGRPGR